MAPLGFSTTFTFGFLDPFTNPCIRAAVGIRVVFSTLVLVSFAGFIVVFVIVAFVVTLCCRTRLFCVLHHLLDQGHSLLFDQGCKFGCGIGSVEE